MLILVARYTFFFWLFIGGSSAEKLLLTQIVAADEEIFRLSSCTARCLSILHRSRNSSKENAFNRTRAPQDLYQKERENQHKGDLQVCFDKCHSNNSVELHSEKVLQKRQENFHFLLVCRDDRSLTFRIDFGHTEAAESAFRSTVMQESNAFQPKHVTKSIKPLKQHRNVEEKIVFFIRINSATDSEHHNVYLSDERLFTIANLTHDSVYNLTVVAAHANNEFSVIAKKEQFATLRGGYMPGNVRDLRVVNFTTMNDGPPDNTRLRAIIVWKPAIDMTCHYNIICYSTETDDMSPFEIRNPLQLYTYEIENLSFSKEYKVGIRGKNTNNEAKESDFSWLTFRAPACVEYYNYNFNICAPLTPHGLTVDKTYLSGNEFALNISWHRPEYLPDYYMLKVLDLNDKNDPYSQNVSKHETNIFIEHITLRGIMYEVHLVAYSPGGKSAMTTEDVTQILVSVQDKTHKAKLIFAIFAPIFCIVILSLTIFIICHRRAKLKRYQERCKYFEELEKKAPIDPKTTFDFSKKNLPLLSPADEFKHFQFDLDEKVFFNDDAIEIERCDVTLYEILGEGAFGLVRRGQLHNKKSGETSEVAVKMLKEQPSIDDVRAFRREIEVMKSVEKHPNIVGILGHCTRRSSEMMLLTEYCSLGNLLDFLRNEWKYLHDLQTKMILLQARQKTSALSLAAINKSYGYDEICTNACKSHVEILVVRANQNDRPLRGSSEQFKDIDRELMNNLIKVKDCKCPQRQRKSQLLRNNQRTAPEPPSTPRIPKNPIQEPVIVESKAFFQSSIDERPPVDREKPQQQQHQQKQKQVLRQCQQQSDTPAEMTLPRVARIPLSGSDLLDIARQVATGMEFLAKNKVVHRDLAARNVLVATDRTIKIADFGLSRDIYQENIYKRSGNGKLPIKWLALESMTHQVYTTQSDVWSYGILLYEIVTLGGSPYPAIPTSRLLHLLKSGYRMEKPKNCRDELYNLMLSCWHANPGERPTFTELINLIDGFISDSGAQQISTATIASTRKEDDMKPTHSLTEDAYLKPL